MGRVIVITLANKPGYLRDAIQSVLAQTRKPDEHIICTDNYRVWPGNTYPPAVFWNEQAARLAPDDYACWLSDDDILLPNYIADLAGYLDAHPDIGACWGHSRHYIVQPDGSEQSARCLPIDGINRLFDGGNQPCGVIDGGQFMVRKSALDKVGYPYAPESIDGARVSDGYLMNRIAEAVGIHPIGLFVLKNRSTPLSSHTRPSGVGLGLMQNDWRARK